MVGIIKYLIFFFLFITGSLLAMVRKALRQVCGMSVAESKRFTLHSLRVGGINYLKQNGVPTVTRALIASHKSLNTSLYYLRSLPIQVLRELPEQFYG